MHNAKWCEETEQAEAVATKTKISEPPQQEVNYEMWVNEHKQKAVFLCLVAMKKILVVFVCKAEI